MTYNGEAELLSSRRSRGKVCARAGLVNTACNAADEDLTIADADVVICCTVAQVSVRTNVPAQADSQKDSPIR